MGWLLSKLDGWKSILGYVALQIPIFGQSPMLLEALNKFIANPSDPAAIVEFLGHLFLAIGLLHKAKKNVTD